MVKALIVVIEFFIRSAACCSREDVRVTRRGAEGGAKQIEGTETTERKKKKGKSTGKHTTGAPKKKEKKNQKRKALRGVGSSEGN